MEQPGLEFVFIIDAGVIGGGWTNCATTLTLINAFLCVNLHIIRKVKDSVWDTNVPRDEIKPLFLIIYKNQLKINQRPKCNTCNYDTTRRNIGAYFKASVKAMIFFCKILEAQATKVKIGKWNYIKPRSFCLAKEAVHSMKRQLTEREKIFSNYSAGKGLISWL